MSEIIIHSTSLYKKMMKMMECSFLMNLIHFFSKFLIISWFWREKTFSTNKRSTKKKLYLELINKSRTFNERAFDGNSFIFHSLKRLF